MYFNSSIGKIYYKKVGHGPHLSFLHGFCEDHSIWDTLCERLQNEYSCLLIDLPGFGKSSLESSAEITDFADAITELFKYEQIESTVLFGHSMGGYISLEMLKLHPNYISGMGLIHSTAESDNADKIKSRQKVIDFLSHHKAQDFLKQFYPNLVAEGNFKNLQHTLWDLVKHTPKASIEIATLAMMKRSDHHKTLVETDIPILFLTGDKDAHFTVESILKQSSECSLAQIDIIKGSGHLSMLEDINACYTAVKSFLLYNKMLRINLKV